MSAAQFRLTEIEKSSALWRRLHAHLVERLAERRRWNDDVAKGPETTAALRGEIKALKHLTEEITQAPRAPQEFAAGES